MIIPKLIAGNWKMNGLAKEGRERVEALAAFVKTARKGDFEMVLCPPATLVSVAVQAVDNSGLFVGGQDCHAEESGAYTGDISARMLKDLGCAYVIVGHSERRQNHGETSIQVAAKAKAAHAAGLKAIICVGETDAERTAGRANDVVLKQIEESFPETATAENSVLAYEPVWAIGTGKVASAEDIRTMHAIIRAKVKAQVKDGTALRLLYGGSVKASNAAEILHTPNVDGVLVGGASLKVDEFTAIASAAVLPAAASRVV